MRQVVNSRVTSSCCSLQRAGQPRAACLSVVAEEQVAAERVTAVDDICDLGMLTLRVLYLQEQPRMPLKQGNLDIHACSTAHICTQLQISGGRGFATCNRL